jgi:cobalt-zinc-cadmium efflux system membrane fusion protein
VIPRRLPLLAGAAALIAACAREPGAGAHAPGDSHAGHAHAAGESHAGHAHGSGEKEAPKDTAAAQAASAPTLCEHGVPAELCTRCNPDLIAVFKDQGDWCEEHGLPESQCLKCNPALTFAAAAPHEDWCKEHAVLESMCTKCNPRLVARFVAAGDYCREHGYPESVCPICHPDRVPAGRPAPVFPEPGLRVRLASAQTTRDAGIETKVAQARRVAKTLEVVGQLEFDQNRLAQLSARAEALIVEVKVDVGDEVAQGQPLVVLTSAAVGSDRARLGAASARVDAARSAVAREEELARAGLSPRKALDDARRELAAAQAEHDALRSSLGAAGAVEGGGGRSVLRAPFPGTVVARDAVPGKTATPGQVLVQLADLSTMWAQLEVPEADASLVRPGQPVRIVLEGTKAAAREAKISRVAPAVDAASRTVRVRVELPNRDGTLKAGVFVRGQIRVTAEHDALLVPRESLQRAEGRTLVFVKRGDQLFEPVVVEAGEPSGDSVEILSGLASGSEVVTTGAFLLKTEIVKESIGAGCCDVEEKR